MTPQKHEEVEKEDWLNRFRYKITNYDSDDGFIVYVPDHDNMDFNVDLIEDFIHQEIERARRETKQEIKRELEGILIDGEKEKENEGTYLKFYLKDLLTSLDTERGEGKI